MLNFTSLEMDIIRIWAERGEGSPFPQEINLLNRMKKYPKGSPFTAMKKEVEGFIGMPITVNGILFPVLYFANASLNVVAIVFAVSLILMVSTFRVKKVI